MSEMEAITTEGCDSLSRCVGEIARRHAPGFSVDALEQLPRSISGELPAHQVNAALELTGINFEQQNMRKLPLIEGIYPALIALSDDRFTLALELVENELLIWDPAEQSEFWVPYKAVIRDFAGQFFIIAANPDQLRAEEAPWHTKKRSHWFWSELHKERNAFWPVMLASLIINLLAVALPLFTMNVYDRVIPNKATDTLWVLGVGVLLVFILEFALRRGRTTVVDQISRRLDMKLSQKIFGRLMATPLDERSGHTGSLAARVSEYSIVRDFFASTVVVLLIDAIFLFAFVGIIAIIGGWLA